MPTSGPFCPFCGQASKLAASDPNFDLHDHVVVCRNSLKDQINSDIQSCVTDSLNRFAAQRPARS